MGGRVPSSRRAFMKPLKFVIEVVLLVPALLVTYEVVDDDAEARAFMKPPIMLLLLSWMMDGLLLCERESRSL